MRYLSHGIFADGQTTRLTPFATFREPGACDDFSKSAIRAFLVLEVLVKARAPLRAVEIASALQLSPSSADRILKSMVDWAYLIFDPITKRYCPSPRVSMFGSTSADHYFGHHALEQLMAAAYRAFGLPVSLSASQGSFMQVIDFLAPDEKSLHDLPYQAKNVRTSPLPPNFGVQSPLFGSCPGAAWLASQSDDRVRASIRLCRRELGSLAEDTDALLTRIAEVRHQGYAFGGISTDDDFRGLSLALPPNPHGIVLVLSMNGHREEMEAQREDMAAAAHGLIRDHIGSSDVGGALSARIC